MPPPGYTSMTPDERDRLIRLEERLSALTAEVHGVATICAKLDRQAQWVRGGLLLAIALGGIASWLGDIWRKLWP